MKSPSVLLALLLAFAGCASLYLASPHQRWRAAPLPARPAGAIGVVFLLASALAFASAMQVAPAVFTFGACVMLLLVVFPYVGAAVGAARRDR